ncbi:hypothetical protein ACUOFC_55430, partial [Escherichia sp. TWPC-MK]
LMKIGRKAADFGNSFNNFTVDGYYFELATNVVKVSKKKAEDLLVERILNPEDLLNIQLIQHMKELEESNKALLTKIEEQQEVCVSKINSKDQQLLE